MGNVIIVGGGAAGMMAAIAAAEEGQKVTLLEQNEKLGKKVFITGKGRCNVTNSADQETVFANIVRNARFLYSSYYQCQNYDVMDWFAKWGMELKVERGERVFPASDKSSDVIRTLERQMSRLGVQVRLHQRVERLILEEGSCTGVVVRSVKMASAQPVELRADAVIVCTGGISYPSTGSTGDGYRFGEQAGHTVIPQTPGLVPLNIKEQFCKDMQGLALKNVTLTLYDGKKELYQGFGEMLFTHFGISGPLVLSASSYLRNAKTKELEVSIDLKPALSRQQLELRLQREFEQFHSKQFKNALVHLFPSSLIPVMVEVSGISPDKKVAEISREERDNLITKMKDFRLHVIGPRSYQEAIITQGGIATKEIAPASMESKKTPGLYFAGEVLDLDAMTGGFNLQIAWSTGWAAGKAAAEAASAARNA